VATIYISPFMPATPAKVFSQLGLVDAAWQGWDAVDFGASIGGTRILRGEPVFPRIDVKEALKMGEKPILEENEIQESEEGINLIGIEDFFQADLRVASIVKAEKVQGTDKLMKLSVDVGGEPRTIVAGIALHYTEDELEAKKIIIVANLKPAKLRGIESQGMLLAASSSDKKQMRLLTVDADIASGSKVG